MSFQTFACRNESDGRRYMMVAPDLECDVGIHATVVPLAWFGIVAMGLGCEEINQVILNPFITLRLPLILKLTAAFPGCDLFCPQ